MKSLKLLLYFFQPTKWSYKYFINPSIKLIFNLIVTVAKTISGSKT